MAWLEEVLQRSPATGTQRPYPRIVVDEETWQQAGSELARFQSEAESAARLDHPGIVPVHEIGELDGRPYFSMGYVEGETLAQRLGGGPLQPREAARIVRDVSRAIDYAHRRGVIHRDLKPSNILIDEGGNPLVSDFGLAKRIDIVATAIFHGMTVDEVSDLDLSYTPPLGSPWDAVQMGAQAWTRVLGSSQPAT